MTKKKNRKTKRLKVEIITAEVLSKEEIERRWNRIFGILEEELRKHRS